LFVCFMLTRIILDYNRESQSFLMHFPGLTFFFNQIGPQVEVINYFLVPTIISNLHCHCSDEIHAWPSFVAISARSIAGGLENIYLLWNCASRISSTTVACQLFQSIGVSR
jgi:hypothetical protein